MARKRMIDPDFWADGTLGKLSPLCRLFYIGSWNFANDQGVLLNKPDTLKAQILPHDPDADVEQFIAALAQLNKFVLFSNGGTRYIWIKNFLTYQKISHPSPTKLPPPPAPELLPEDSVSIPEDSRSTPPQYSVVEVKRSKEDMSTSISDEETQCWNILDQIENFPPRTSARIKKLREYITEFAEVDPVKLCKNFAAVKMDKPLAKKGNPISQLRKFFQNAKNKGWGDALRTKPSTPRSKEPPPPDRGTPEEEANIMKKLRAENEARKAKEHEDDKLPF